MTDARDLDYDTTDLTKTSNQLSSLYSQYTKIFTKKIHDDEIRNAMCKLKDKCDSLTSLDDFSEKVLDKFNTSNDEILKYYVQNRDIIKRDLKRLNKYCKTAKLLIKLL